MKLVDIKYYIKVKLIWTIEFLIVLKRIIIGWINRFPFFVINLFHTKKIAYPGILEYKGGIFNTSGILLNNVFVLLGKGQKIVWYKARGRKKNLFLQGKPVLFLLDNNSKLSIIKKTEIKEIDFAKNNKYAIEDFRLFTWNNKIISNHSYIDIENNKNRKSQPSVRSTLSELDIENNILKLIGFPKLDFPTNKVEKNWVYLNIDDSLYLFYSIAPYIVLKLDSKNDLIFKTIINKKLDNRMSNPGNFNTLVSLSTNPIDYNENNFLLIIHQIKHKSYGRCYYHWAILIDKKSLLPIKITKKPIFSGIGARGREPGIRYITSIIKRGSEIIFFAGEGDIYSTVTTKKIKYIKELFINLQS